MPSARRAPIAIAMQGGCGQAGDGMRARGGLAGLIGAIRMVGAAGFAGCGFGGLARAAGDLRGKLAGGPEGDHVLQAADHAGEDGQNQGVQRREDSCLGGTLIGLRADRGGNAGDLLGQGWGAVF